MKIALFSFILIIAASHFSCNSNSNYQNGTSSTPDKEKWYEGGTLHKATIAKWKTASDRNKLATCADFAATIDNSITMTELRARAVALKNCIDEATRDINTVDTESVAAIASACTILLGY